MLPFAFSRLSKRLIKTQEVPTLQELQPKWVVFISVSQLPNTEAAEPDHQTGPATSEQAWGELDRHRVATVLGWCTVHQCVRAEEGAWLLQKVQDPSWPVAKRLEKHTYTQAVHDSLDKLPYTPKSNLVTCDHHSEQEDANDRTQWRVYSAQVNRIRPRLAKPAKYSFWSVINSGLVNATSVFIDS